MTDIPKFGLSPKDVAAMTPRSLNSVYAALQADMLAGAQNENQRSANWVITPDAVKDWVERGCPFPRFSHAKKTA